MLASPTDVLRAFEELAVGSRPTFSQLVTKGRLHYADALDGTCDLIDDMSSRLLCECIGARIPLLIIWPDERNRRAPLALATAVICDSILHLESESSHGRVLYVGSGPEIKEHFASVRVGNLPLDVVFAQEFSRGGGRIRKSGPESTLPVVTTVTSPAQPSQLIHQLQPRWIAVDCGTRHSPAWLGELLSAAKAQRIPVIGWSPLHLSGAIDQWLSHDGSVLHWPKTNGNSTRIGSFEDILSGHCAARISPLVLNGPDVADISERLAQAYVHLARHVGKPLLQLERDATSVAWRYLRLIESIPVPFPLYESECVNYWGMPGLSRLRSTVERFAQALPSRSDMHTDLTCVLEHLYAAETMLSRQSDPPLWREIISLAVDSSGPAQLVFNSRAHRDMFRFALLSKFNISAEDLSELGIKLIALSDYPKENADGSLGETILLGLPSSAVDWRVEPILQFGGAQVIVWPHLVSTLHRRAVSWSRGLRGSYSGPSPLEIQDGPLLESGNAVSVTNARYLNTAPKSETITTSSRGLAEFWNQPDAASAIKALFDANDVSGNDIDAGDELSATNPHYSQSTSDNADWVEMAVQVTFDDGGVILLPLDDQVNVISRTDAGINIEERYSRSLRPGDEVLLVNGDHRRGIYDLLVSRVHNNPAIAPWLALVDKWHQDLRKAFDAARSISGTSFESLLTNLRSVGSEITSSAAVRAWVLGLTLAPSDWRDTQRLGAILNIEIAKQFPREIGNAAARLAGLHRSLANRLNRWLESEDAGAAVLSGVNSIVDAELGLSIDDFKHSIVRGRIESLLTMNGPFLRSHIGRLHKE